MSGCLHKEAGFTLVEVLISLFIFSLITAGTMTALTQSIRGKDRLAVSMEELNELNAARAIIKADMSTLTLRTSRDELGGLNPYVLTTDGEALLSFTRRGRENPSGIEARGDLERVEYHFEDGALVRRSYAHENPAQLPTKFDRTLLDDLKAVEVSAIGYGDGRVINLEDFRIAARETLVPGAILIEVTDAYDEVTQHLFEMGT